MSSIKYKKIEIERDLSSNSFLKFPQFSNIPFKNFMLWHNKNNRIKLNVMKWESFDIFINFKCGWNENEKKTWENFLFMRGKKYVPTNTADWWSKNITLNFHIHSLAIFFLSHSFAFILLVQINRGPLHSDKHHKTTLRIYLHRLRHLAESFRLYFRDIQNLSGDRSVSRVEAA